MRCISFSLWGDDPIYTVGAVRNAELASLLFPDWTCVFHCDRFVPADVVAELEGRDKVEIRPLDTEYAPGDSRGMFARMLVAGEDVECVICRDADSRLSERERLAVDDWLAGGADLHVMRDHPLHGVAMPGGMWGVRGGRLTGIAAAIRRYAPTEAKGQDQAFLREWVWERVCRRELSCTVHDPFFAGRPFPRGATRGEANGGVWFVGQVFDADDRHASEVDLDTLRASERRPAPWRRLRRALHGLGETWE